MGLSIKLLDSKRSCLQFYITKSNGCRDINSRSPHALNNETAKPIPHNNLCKNIINVKNFKDENQRIDSL